MRGLVPKTKFDQALIGVWVACGAIFIRSAGSKGVIDLCAIRGDGIILIQVKKAAADVIALQAVAAPVEVRREVWARESGGWWIVPL